MKELSYILMLFVSITSYAQEYFNVTYVQPNLNMAVNIVELDSGYFVLGQRPTTVQRKMAFYNLKLNGDTNWVREFYDGIKIFYPQKMFKRDTSVFVFGAIIDSNLSNNADLFLASFDLDANLNWIKRYGGGDFDAGWDFKTTPDGGFILAGSKTVNSIDFEDFYLVKTDSLGIVEWEQTYGGGGVEIAYSVALTSDGGYLFSGYSNSYSSSYDCLVFKTDSLGNELWHQKFGGVFIDYEGVVIELNDQRYLVSTALRSSANQLEAILLKLDFNGQVLWQKAFPYDSYATLSIPMIQNQDGAVIIGGMMKNLQNQIISRVIKLDPLGNEIWQREYFFRSDAPNYIRDIKTTSGGGYILCGSAFDSSFIQRAWIVKLDCFGCDSTLCYYQDSVCDFYDCTQFPITADFNASDYIVNLANGEDTVTFVNNSGNTTNQVWQISGGQNSIDTSFYTDSTVSYSFLDTGTYEVSLVVYHGICSDTVVQTIQVVDVAGLDESLSSPSVPLPGGKLYPNPSNGSFTVENNSGVALEFEIYDALGKLVFKQQLSNKLENLHLHLENGVYVARFSYNGFNHQQKMIVRK